MKIFNRPVRQEAREPSMRLIAAALTAAMLTACANVKQSDDAVLRAARKVEATQAKTQSAPPVVTRTAGSWLLGDTVEVAPELSPALLREIAWQPSHKVSLSELAAYITQKTGLAVDIAQVRRAGTTTPAAPTSGMLPSVTTTFTSPATMMGATQGGSQGNGKVIDLPLMTVSFQGTVKGLLDFARNDEGVWWRMGSEGVEFYRTATKTFYLPAINRKANGSSTIVTQSGPGSLNSSSGGSGGTSSSGSSSGGGATGSATTGDSYDVDVWKTLESTAKTVAGQTSEGTPAEISVEPGMSSVTVTGTPPQIKNVEQWVKDLTEKLSQQVMITASIYSVDITNEDNYSWSPSVIYSKLSNMYGVSLAGAGVPPVVGTLSPMVLSAKAGSSSSLNGSDLAVNALSTLGHVAETVTQTVVTLNGQPASMQVANEVTYLASSGTTATANVGTSSTLTPGVVTTGFTANFTPQVVNGKILLSMGLTNSVLNSIDTATSNGSSIQTPNVSTTPFQQSVSLTPGAALMLAGLSQDNNSVNRSGVGSAFNYVLGGGLDSSRHKKLIAIVITARVL